MIARHCITAWYDVQCCLGGRMIGCYSCCWWWWWCYHWRPSSGADPSQVSACQSSERLHHPSFANTRPALRGCRELRGPAARRCVPTPRQCTPAQSGTQSSGHLPAARVALRSDGDWWTPADGRTDGRWTGASAHDKSITPSNDL